MVCGLEVSELQGNKLYSDLIGQQFNKDTMNCYTLCQVILGRVGKKLPDQIFIQSVLLRSEALELGRKEFGIRIKDPEPFCVVMFRRKRQWAGHIGVVLEDCYRFIHVTSNCPVSIERLDSPLWENRIEGYFRYKD